MRVQRSAGFGPVVSLLVLALLPVALPVQAESQAVLVLSLTTECAETMAYETMTVRAFLMLDGVGVEGARLRVRSSIGGNLSAPINLGRGVYEFTWTAPRVLQQTYAMLYVQASDGVHADAASRLAVLVDPFYFSFTNPEPLFLLARPSSSTLRPGGTIEVVVYVYTFRGYLVQGATVTTSADSRFATVGAVYRNGCGYGFTVTASSAITSDTGFLVVAAATKVDYQRATTRVALLIVTS